MSMYEGGCECGDVRYRLNGEPIITNCCHCRDCQTITGSAFAVNAMIETGLVEVTKGTPVERTLERPSPKGDTHAWRCARCGTLLWADHPMFGERTRFVRVGTLDTGEALTPDVHYFTRSKHPWVHVPSGTPHFATLPEDGVGIDLGPDRMARLAKVFA